MDTNIQEYDFNNSYVQMNRDVLNIYIASYPHLSAISFDNNVLYYNNEKIQLGRYHLSQLSAAICERPPQDFFEIVRIFAYIENNLNNEDFYLFSINEILNKNYINNEEKNILNTFINQYLKLKKYESFLMGNSVITLRMYDSIVENVSALSLNSLTEGQRLLREKTLVQTEDVGGRSIPMVRVLTNPNVPNMAPDDDQNLSKAGFASILFIIYTLINAAIILAIHMIK